MSSEDEKVIENMRKYGGSFVHALAMAALAADSENLQRLREAFAKEWFKYSDQWSSQQREES